MTLFAERCGAWGAAASERLLREVHERGLERVRVSFADLHGLLRGKTLMPAALKGALENGVGVVSTLLLKDTSDRTAFKVFEPGALAGLPGFGSANNLVLVPDASSFITLPWSPGTGWLRGDLFFDDGRPVAVEPRRVLRAAVEALAGAGHGLVCGLEVEFHVYRILEERLDPADADWPGEPPRLQLLHPGWQLLGDAHADQAEEALAIVQRTAQGLGLPLRSVEIELGPSQVEAVFDPCDALTAADRMIVFRNGVKQALRRAGYHASFVCRPPFENIMASGWHLHQSLVELASGRNAFVRERPAGSFDEATHWLSDTGAHWLAGLLAHAPGSTALAVPTINGYGRFRPNAMAPTSALWARDHRGAMLRVLGGAGDEATRIENRVGEPLANPYLHLAAQVFAGLDGLVHRRLPPLAAAEVYGGHGEPLPATLGAALDAFAADPVLQQGLGAPLAHLYQGIKRHEIARHAAAGDTDAWERREYFARY
jgi:glutamine synthetase